MLSVMIWVHEEVEFPSSFSLLMLLTAGAVPYTVFVKYDFLPSFLPSVFVQMLTCSSANETLHGMCCIFLEVPAVSVQKSPTNFCGYTCRDLPDYLESFKQKISITPFWLLRMGNRGVLYLVVCIVVGGFLVVVGCLVFGIVRFFVLWRCVL